MTEMTAPAARQARRLDVLVCPLCRSPLTVDDPVQRADGVAGADLGCAAHGRVGVIDRHRPSFLDRELAAIPPGTTATRQVEVAAPSEVVATSGRWWPIAEGWAGAADEGTSMVVEGRFTAVRFDVLRDDWSPDVELLVDGVPVGRHALAEEGGPIDCADLPDTTHRVELRVARTSDDGRVVVTGTTLATSLAEVVAPGWSAVDRGNPYPHGFLELLDLEPSDALVLDCGGGDRRLGDPRVVNLEYLPYDAPDLYGDGLALPFADDSFDLILSQAVLEHVPDPQRALDEMARVLRPGGRIHCEIAFTQPLHAVPSHYFNVTPHGAAHLFRDWEVERLDWFGGPAVTVDWWLQLLDADTRWEPERLALFRELLGDLDTMTSHEQLKDFASAVLIVATTPSG